MFTSTINNCCKTLKASAKCQQCEFTFWLTYVQTTVYTHCMTTFYNIAKAWESAKSCDFRSLTFAQELNTALENRRQLILSSLQCRDCVQSTTRSTLRANTQLIQIFSSSQRPTQTLAQTRLTSIQHSSIIDSYNIAQTKSSSRREQLTSIYAAIDRRVEE